MRKLMIVSALVIASQVVGCGKETAMTDSTDLTGTLFINHYGYLGRNVLTELPNGRVNIKTVEVVIKTKPHSKLIGRLDDIFTQEYVLLQARKYGSPTYHYHRYGILFGPDPRIPNETAIVEVRDGADPAEASTPVVQIACGWVYLAGHDPQVQTSWVAAGATGSAIIMHITHDDFSPPREVHRYYFRSGSSGFVQSRGSGIRKNFASGDNTKYVDAYDINTLSEPILIEPGSSADTFLSSIRDHIIAMDAATMN